jgi:glycosyltransferase involved in cell wall biosynthesis
MRVVNIMLARGAGGIEQAAADYCEALKLFAHDVVAVTFPGAWVNQPLAQKCIPTMNLFNLGAWDIFAMRRLRSMLDNIKPDAIIVHGNRAATFALRAAKGKFPVVVLANNYNIQRYVRADAVLTSTQDLANAIAQLGMTKDRIFHVPNMVRCENTWVRKRAHNPPVIGTMGRFVAKKGFDVYIDALKILKERGHVFHAILGGSGEEEKKLHERAQKAGLGDILGFPGWVRDKRAFFDSIDLFCLPSLHEPFGIVLLEAFAHGVPIVTTNTEGPLEIVTHCREALMVEKGNAEAMANALEMLLKDEKLAASLAAAAVQKVRDQYSMEIIGQKIDDALNAIVNPSAPGKRAEKAAPTEGLRNSQPQ